MKPGGLFPSAQSETQSDSKKHKKKKKKSKRRRSSSSSSSSDGDQWVEKPSSSAATAPIPSVPHGQDKPSSSAVEPPAAPKRDAWMEVENIFSGVTAGEVRDRRRQTKQEAREAEDRQRQADYEARKWRDTPDSSAKPATKIGDGGASWLRRALQRAKQQAAESGRPLEEIVAERWGSMEKLQSMLDAAEGRKTPAQPAAAAEKGTRERGWRRDYPDRRRSRSKERRRSRSRERAPNVNNERKRSRSRDRRRSRSRDRKRSRSRDRKRSRSRSRDRRRSRSRSRDRKRSRSRSRERRRSRSRSRDRRRSRSRSRDRRRSRSRSKERRLDRSRSRERRRATNSKEREEHHRGKEQSRSRSVDKKDSDKRVRSPDRRKLDASNISDRGSSVMADGDKARKEDSASRSGDAATSSKISNTSEYTRHLSPDKSGSDEDEDGSSTRAEQVRPLTDDEMNALAAKILKAELNGDDDDVAELQKQLDAARQLRAAGGGTARAAQKSEKVVIVVGKGERGGPSGGDNRANKKRKADTHRGGERTKYFADDDRLNLRDMFEREKRTTPADEAAALARLAARGVRQNRHHDDDHGLDEQLAERAGRAEPERAQDERTAARARTQHRHMERCTRCFDSRHTLRHLIAALGDKSYLSLPAGRSVTEHHCLIVPLQHAVSLTAVEEDTWEEMMRFRKAVVAMFAAEDDQDVIFFESALKLQTHPHAVLHCVPVPRETGDLAPIYFKKALEESETEWSQNKKVVDLRGRDVRRAVPKGLPYFFVDFGMQPGFAHVVEDEDLFQENFAQEVIGGMLELDPSSWRRSKNETLEQQRKKAMDFAKIWDPHDFTKEG